jgi:antitoxin component of MazEF toxin-antitoxin module
MAASKSEVAVPHVKQLTKIGNSTGLIIDRALLQQLDLGPEGKVEIRVEGHSLVITPHRHATNEEFDRAANRVFTTRKRLLKRLAK